jgi:hypothetical protein
MATREQVRAMIQSQPFRPFTVRLADGRSFVVRNPENVGCDIKGREMSLYDNDGWHRIDMRHIVGFETVEPAA